MYMYMYMYAYTVYSVYMYVYACTVYVFRQCFLVDDGLQSEQQGRPFYHLSVDCYLVYGFDQKSVTFHVFTCTSTASIWEFVVIRGCTIMRTCTCIQIIQFTPSIVHVQCVHGIASHQCEHLENLKGVMHAFTVQVHSVNLPLFFSILY